MPLYPTWDDIALRLVLTMIAGAIIGFNRGVRGHAAGLRTTILVGLAASAAMIQANILLSVGGRAADSFGVMDLMRLPLGILTGVGFIGVGAILKRGDLVTGVTTPATLWVMTVIGLCLGGGQLVLGMVVALLAVATLFALGWLDRQIPREQRALLVIESGLSVALTSGLADSIDGREVAYGFGELDELVLAYATTIHKSQGSEYSVVVIPLVTQHYAMLARNLFYTGITRGKKLVVLVGQRRALAIAVKNGNARRRWSKLSEWLRNDRAVAHI